MHKRVSVPLQDFCRIIQGGRLGLSGNDFVPEGFPAYGAGGVNGYLSTHEFDEPAVVLSAIGARCGKCFYADGKWVSLANTQLIFPDPGRADCKFLWYQLNDEGRWHRSGTGQPFIKPSDVKAHRVFLPTLLEQRRIAEILDNADALRAMRRAALAQLDTLAQSIFLDMFGDPAANPKGWPRESLGNITLKITDGEHLNPSFSQMGMPIVMAGDVLEDRIDFGSSKFVERDLGVRFRRKCDPERDDLLIVSRGATIGRLCVVRTAQEFCLMGSVILVKPVRDKIDPIFLSTFLKHPVSRHALYKTSGSSAQQAIYLKDVKKLACILPPISLQREFSCQVVSIEQVKAIQRASLVELNALFGALQHRAFRGDLKQGLGEVLEETRGISL